MTKNILIIGCGEGERFSSFSKNNYLFGIDISKSSILKAKQRYPLVDFRVMNVQSLIFKNCFFDEIYAFDVLEHVDDFNKSFSEITRVLRNGGKIVIEIPYWRSEKLFQNIRSSYFSEVHHKRIFYNKQLERTLIRNNYTILKVKRIKFIDNIEIYFHLKRRHAIQSQLGDFNRLLPVYERVFLLLFSPKILQSKLRYLAPILLLTLPIQAILSLIYPKSIHIEAIKKFPFREVNP